MGVLGSLDVLIYELRRCLDAIDKVKIAELVKAHRDKIHRDTEAMGFVTDVAWALITRVDPKPGVAVGNYVYRVIRSSVDEYSDWQQLQRGLRTLVSEGYDYSSVNNDNGRSLMAALDGWSSAQDALKGSCAFTSVCDDFIHTLSYNKFVDLKESYHIELGRVIKTQVRDFDY